MRRMILEELRPYCQTLLQEKPRCGNLEGRPQTINELAQPGAQAYLNCAMRALVYRYVTWCYAVNVRQPATVCHVVPGGSVLVGWQ